MFLLNLSQGCENTFVHTIILSIKKFNSFRDKLNGSRFPRLKIARTRDKRWRLPALSNAKATATNYLRRPGATRYYLEWLPRSYLNGTLAREWMEALGPVGLEQTRRGRACRLIRHARLLRPPHSNAEFENSSGQQEALPGRVCTARRNNRRLTRLRNAAMQRSRTV